jgi:arylsulfatase A-like enzyme
MSPTRVVISAPPSLRQAGRVKQCFIPVILTLALCASIQATGQEETRPPSPPNIVFILADDLGFSDLNAYGSEIQTPVLDHLAREGLRFSNFHTAANCAPSRAMMLTGVSNELAGVPNIPEMVPPEHRAESPKLGTLNHQVATVASVLNAAGYHTYMTGKWHLGSAPEQRPFRRGFEQTMALMESGADNWEHKSYLPIYDDATWTEKGEITRRPNGVYSSTYLVDRMIEFIDGNLSDGDPFFAYLPFQAVHIPVQAPEAYTDAYRETYKDGWHAIREARHRRAISLGLIPEGTSVRDMPTTEQWSSLTLEARAYEAARMAVYAGMVTAMDAEIGRLLKFLSARGVLSNTILIFTSDNGAEGSGNPRQNAALNRFFMKRAGYRVDQAGLGTQGSFNAISPSFASAAVSPLSEYKFYSGEGGMRVPLIISGGDIPASGKITPSFAWATDIAATILDIAKVSHPGERFGGRPILPMTGRSLLPLLSDPEARIYREDDPIGYDLAGNSALFKGDFKLQRSDPPMGDGRWRLFNIRQDPAETQDLAEAQPERMAELIRDYEAFTLSQGVRPTPNGYRRQLSILSFGLKNRLGDTLLAWLLVVITLTLITAIYAIARRPQQP